MRLNGNELLQQYENEKICGSAICQSLSYCGTNVLVLFLLYPTDNNEYARKKKREKVSFSALSGDSRQLKATEYITQMNPNKRFVALDTVCVCFVFEHNNLV